MDSEAETGSNLLSGTNLIIIPAFNEERQVASVIRGAREFSDADIVVIDDGSRDLTAEVARREGAIVVRHPFNVGYGATVQTGYKYALENNYCYLLQLDGDGQHDPRYINDLFSIVQNQKCDLAIGSRFLGDNQYKVGFLKSAGVRLFRRVIRMATGETITDPTSGYRCMNRDLFRYLTADSYPWDYPDANTIIDLHRMGFKIAELPVAMVPNPEGRYMHRGIFRITYYIFRVFLSILVTLLRKKPGA
jgi:glycosyltransferase involved in cell wall biosynthesis